MVWNFTFSSYGNSFNPGISLVACLRTLMNFNLYILVLFINDWTCKFKRTHVFSLQCPFFPLHFVISFAKQACISNQTDWVALWAFTQVVLMMKKHGLLNCYVSINQYVSKSLPELFVCCITCHFKSFDMSLNWGFFFFLHFPRLRFFHPQ